MESLITFYSEDVPFQWENPDKIIAWIEQVAEQHKHQIDQVSYIFCSDAYLLSLNKQFLDHDYYTDILTFPVDPLRIPKGLAADIFISIERVQENAEAYETSFKQELLRVMIHGVLHLMGFDDHGDEAQIQMRKREDEALSLIHLG